MQVSDLIKALSLLHIVCHIVNYQKIVFSRFAEIGCSLRFYKDIDLASRSFSGFYSFCERNVRKSFQLFKADMTFSATLSLLRFFSGFARNVSAISK